MKANDSGFTLIEVLIALAIIAIALIAIVKITSLDIQDTTYIEQKTYSHWIAMNTIANVQLGLVLPPVKDQMTTMLGKKFYWSVSETATPDPYVNKINIAVSLQPGAAPILKLQGFNGVKKAQ